MNRSKTFILTICALFAAITGILSQVLIPIGLVPINMATMSVFMAGGLLGGKNGAKSMIIYLFLGFIGVPVFSSFRSGPGHLLGPTGGYVWGYILAAFLTGFFADRYGRKLTVLIPSMLLGMISYYILGTVWFLCITESTLMGALSICVFPFIPGDLIKIGVAAYVVVRVYGIMYRSPAQMN